MRHRGRSVSTCRCHGVTSGRRRGQPVVLGFSIGAYAVLNTCGLLLLRAALRDRSLADRAELLVDPRLLGGLALYVLGFLTWIATLSRYQLSTVYPIFVGVSYVSIAVASAVVLGEDLTATKLLGITLVGVGVLFVVH